MIGPGGTGVDLFASVMPNVTGTPEVGFGVYIHWPFCAAKCPYCDFNSHVRRGGVDQERFAAALIAEMRAMAALTPGRTVTSVFLGGGTPSLMEPAVVGGVLDAVGRAWTVAPDAEITLEANPTSVEADRFRGYRAAGVNRVSLGVQALDDASLKLLGRLHDVEQALAAVELARATFPRLSFDLIYARPGQTVAGWVAELHRAIEMAADHLSLYQLTIEPDTPFAALHDAGKLVIPDPDLAADLFAATREVTERAGLPAYEISNHAVPGAESRHNLVYWRYGEYVGIGAGAHGRIVLGGGVERLATVTERDPERWASLVEARGNAVVSTERISGETAGDEMLLMGLRLNEGIDPRRYEHLSGRRFDERRIADLLEHGMIEVMPNGRIRASRDGFFVLDAVVADLAA
jgi:putative oxygen-independent coproporphyrinogen III oxidase